MQMNQERQKKKNLCLNKIVFAFSQVESDYGENKRVSKLFATANHDFFFPLLHTFNMLIQRGVLQELWTK